MAGEHSDSVVPKHTAVTAPIAEEAMDSQERLHESGVSCAVLPSLLNTATILQLTTLKLCWEVT